MSQNHLSVKIFIDRFYTCKKDITHMDETLPLLLPPLPADFYSLVITGHCSMEGEPSKNSVCYLEIYYSTLDSVSL